MPILLLLLLPLLLPILLPILLPRLLGQDRMTARAQQNPDVQHTLTCSFLEIYNETIRDLFDPTTRKEVGYLL
jgi:hypothetical protein